MRAFSASRPHTHPANVRLSEAGNYGESEVRVVNLVSGRVEETTSLDHQYFGEGLAKQGDRLYQITWERPDGFIYSTDGLKQVMGCGCCMHGISWAVRVDARVHAVRMCVLLLLLLLLLCVCVCVGGCARARVCMSACSTAGHMSSTQQAQHRTKQIGTFKTPLRDGWGVAADGDQLVVSDGTSQLTWLDPDDGFRRVRQVTVKAEGREVRFLNEVRPACGRMRLAGAGRSCAAACFSLQQHMQAVQLPVEVLVAAVNFGCR